MLNTYIHILFLQLSITIHNIKDSNVIEEMPVFSSVDIVLISFRLDWIGNE